MANFVLISLGALLFVYSISVCTGKKLDEACGTPQDCTVFGSICKSDVCKCDDTKSYLTENNMCVAKANATCTAADKPGCLENASCKNGVCKCNENYKANAKMTQCESTNGAAAITFSLMLTVAAILTSRFF